MLTSIFLFLGGDGLGLMTGIFITRDGGSGGGGGGEAGGGVGLLGSFSGWTVGLGRKGLNLDKAKAIAPETGGCTRDGGGPGDMARGGPGDNRGGVLEGV